MNYLVNVTKDVCKIKAPWPVVGPKVIPSKNAVTAKKEIVNKREVNELPPLIVVPPLYILIIVILFLRLITVSESFVIVATFRHKTLPEAKPPIVELKLAQVGTDEMVVVHVALLTRSELYTLVNLVKGRVVKVSGLQTRVHVSSSKCSLQFVKAVFLDVEN